MSVDTFTLSGPDAAVILRVFEWDDASREALAQAAYDAVEPKSGLGSFEPLAKFADRVHWLYYPDVESSSGLEKLTAVRRITFGGELPQPRFDLRKLPELRVLEFRGAVPDVRHLNHPHLRYLQAEALKAADLAFLADAKELQALGLRRCGLTSLKGCEALASLKELRLLGAKKLEDISSISAANGLEILEIEGARSLRDTNSLHALRKLRYLFVEAEESSQAGLGWLADMPHLECAGLWAWDGLPICRTWNVLAYGWKPRRWIGLSSPGIRACTISCSLRMQALTCRLMKCCFPHCRLTANVY
jgi:hypothetical protein